MSRIDRIADFSSEHREGVRTVVDLVSVPGVLNELGIGVIVQALRLIAGAQGVLRVLQPFDAAPCPAQVNTCRMRSDGLMA